MSIRSVSPHELMRRAIAAMDEDAIFDVIDDLNLNGAKWPAVVAIPLKSLQKKHDLISFASGAPIDAVSSLLEFLAMEPLEQVVSLLGGHAENPTFEQLSEAITAFRAQGATRNHVLAVLALAAGQEFPAAAACRRILDEEADLQLPELAPSSGTHSLLNPKEPDATVIAQRRQRREEAKARKKAQADHARTPKSKYDKKPKTTSAGSAATLPVAPVVVVTRRTITLTPAELASFDPAHGLAGWVVMADVPFDATDPAIPEVQAKIRPAVVVAGSDAVLLVRGIYSDPFVSRTLFSPWRRVGLDHVSYIDDRRHAVSVDETITKIARLTDAEWNSLL